MLRSSRGDNFTQTGLAQAAPFFYELIMLDEYDGSRRSEKSNGANDCEGARCGCGVFAVLEAETKPRETEIITAKAY